MRNSWIVSRKKGHSTSRILLYECFPLTLSKIKVSLFFSAKLKILLHDRQEWVTSWKWRRLLQETVEMKARLPNSNAWSLSALVTSWPSMFKHQGSETSVWFSSFPWFKLGASKKHKEKDKDRDREKKRDKERKHRERDNHKDRDRDIKIFLDFLFFPGQ